MSVIFHLTRKGYMETKYFAKKRLMFIQDEDYNYLVYNSLIILYVLKCTDKSKAFNDFRKIAYLIDFVNININSNSLTEADYANIYSKAQLKKQLIYHIILILKNNELIDIDVNTTHQSLNIWLKLENIPDDFFENSIFENEIQNVNDLNKSISLLRTTTIKRLSDILFTQHNVLTWEI